MVHKIENIKLTEDSLYITVDETAYKFLLKEVSPLLYKAASREKEYFDVSSSGYGIHWPLIDEDLSIDGLLKYKAKDIQQKSFKTKKRSKKVKNG